MARRTYVDASVLIAAFQGREPAAERALRILEDPERSLVVSGYVRLEVLPKPTFYGRTEELDFMRSCLERAEEIPSSPPLTERALDLACRYDLSAVDALHVAAAAVGAADELVTLEKPEKPICRVKELRVTSLYSASSSPSGNVPRGPSESPHEDGRR